MAGRGAPRGNEYARKGREVTAALYRALARDNYSRLRQGCEAIADAFAAGTPWAAHFVAERLEGKVMAMPELPEDRAFSITWTFGPAAIEPQQNQPLTLEAGPIRQQSGEDGGTP